jgi:hypothetical protein
MFTGRRPLRAFFSIAFAVLLLSSTIAAQDRPAGAPGPSDATALPILDLNPLARPTPEKTSVAQDRLFDFTLPRMKPVGLIPPSNRGESSVSQAGSDRLRDPSASRWMMRWRARSRPMRSLPRRPASARLTGAIKLCNRTIFRGSARTSSISTTTNSWEIRFSCSGAESSFRLCLEPFRSLTRIRPLSARR